MKLEFYLKNVELKKYLIFFITFKGTIYYHKAVDQNPVFDFIIFMR